MLPRKKKKERKNSYEWSEKASLRRQYLIKNKNSQPSRLGEEQRPRPEGGTPLECRKKTAKAVV